EVRADVRGAVQAGGGHERVRIIRRRGRVGMRLRTEADGHGYGPGTEEERGQDGYREARHGLTVARLARSVPYQAQPALQAAPQPQPQLAAEAEAEAVLAVLALEVAGLALDAGLGPEGPLGPAGEFDA